MRVQTDVTDRLVGLLTDGGRIYLQRSDERLFILWAINSNLNCLKHVWRARQKRLCYRFIVWLVQYLSICLCSSITISCNDISLPYPRTYVRLRSMDVCRTRPMLQCIRPLGLCGRKISSVCLHVSVRSLSRSECVRARSRCYYIGLLGQSDYTYRHRLIAPSFWFSPTQRSI